MRRLVEQVIAARREGQDTVTIAQLHRMLVAEYPEWRQSQKGFRDHVNFHVAGGWPEVKG